MNESEKGFSSQSETEKPETKIKAKLDELRGLIEGFKEFKKAGVYIHSQERDRHEAMEDYYEFLRDLDEYKKKFDDYLKGIDKEFQEEDFLNKLNNFYDEVERLRKKTKEKMGSTYYEELEDDNK